MEETVKIVTFMLNNGKIAVRTLNRDLFSDAGD